MENFTDKVAVITGGASGIGLAVATQLAAAGCRLVLADIEADSLSKAADSLGGDRERVMTCVTDVSQRDAVMSLADAAYAQFGQVDIVMNNAGVAVFGDAQDMTHHDWAWTIDVNLWGPINGVEAFVPRMIEQGTGGHVLFTASFAGLVANRALAAYNVTKAAVVALAESLRKDVREQGIGVSVLCPMRVESRIDYSARNRPPERGGPQANRTYTEEELSALEGRMLPVEPVATLVLDAIRNNQLYIHTHREAAEYFARRAARINDAFDLAL